MKHPLTAAILVFACTPCPGATEEPHKVLDPGKSKHLHESAHFVARWNDNDGVELSDQDLNKGLATLEGIRDFYLGKVGFAKPEVWNVEIPFENAPNAHATLMQNFVNAILDGEPLIAPGKEGIHSVELANVMLYSSLIDQTVALPMDSAAYEQKLNQLIAG